MLDVDSTAPVALGCATLASMVYQNLPYESGCYCDEVGTALQIRGLTAEQTQICLVNESRTLQGVVWPLPLQVIVGNPAELVVNQRQQLGERLLVAFDPKPQKL